MPGVARAVVQAGVLVGLAVVGRDDVGQMRLQRQLVVHVPKGQRRVVIPHQLAQDSFVEEGEPGK